MKNLKKKLMGALLLTTVLLGTACGGSNDTTTTPSDSGEQENETNEQLRLRASSGASELHPFHIGFLGPMMERIEEETNGELSFDIFTSGELVELGGEYDALRQGTIDVALSLLPPYDPQRFPYTEVAMLPLLESDTKIATEAMHNLMKSDHILADGKTYYELEFAEKGLVSFVIPVTEPYVLTTTNQNKIETAEDLSRALRIRSSSRVHEILSNNLGFTSVSIPATDAYDALSRGAIDGTLHSVHDWPVFGIEGILKHSLEGANFGHFVGHLAMTEETWNKIPTETQEKIRQAADEIVISGTQAISDAQERGAQAFTESGGEFTHLEDLDPSVVALVNDAIVNTWFDWIDTLEEQGHAGQEIAKLWRDLVVEAGATLPQEIMDIQ
ncbi:TRAP transporter substrate-binding protein DctP [Bacillus sp. FJAT-45350]|uniref:TRAP transporter substrate-binding protein DctP n=1 Tax=Bacillus sp. FJAT-45350 TaxID=2011014 RepID=UPI000BB751CF|nr:TRAP transporter substrate-binding protein DctP [Bacillus sp. FJAT-45350]